MSLHALVVVFVGGGGGVIWPAKAFKTWKASTWEVWVFHILHKLLVLLIKGLCDLLMEMQHHNCHI